MFRISWAKAKTTLAGLFAEWPEQWPQRLAPVHLARLQAPRIERSGLDEVISAACAAGELPHGMAVFTRPPVAAGGVHGVMWISPVRSENLPAIAAGDFDAWLRAQGETPSAHVAAWLEATGQSAEPTAAEPVLAVPAKGTGKIWDADRLAKLNAYREQHGTKKAAEHFGVTTSRVRALLPTDKTATKGYSAFTHRLK